MKSVITKCKYVFDPLECPENGLPCELYKKAVKLWGNALPGQITALNDLSEDSVRRALMEIMDDLLSDTWLDDSKIAWKLLQGRA